VLAIIVSSASSGLFGGLLLYSSLVFKLLVIFCLLIKLV
jgi:hypothetical protein